MHILLEVSLKYLYYHVIISIYICITPSLCLGRFLEVGKVVLEVLQISPEVHTIVQQILNTSFQSMKTAAQALDSAEGNPCTSLFIYLMSIGL